LTALGFLPHIRLMTDRLTVRTPMLIPSAENVEITPAMLTVLWGITDALDQLRLDRDKKGGLVPELVAQRVTDAIWLRIPAQRLRPRGKTDNGTLVGKTDNVWLRQILDRLLGLKLGGEYRGDPWGAVMIAEWRIEKHGSLVRVLVPPAAAIALLSGTSYAKIEIAATYRMKGNARRLYAALADKKHQHQPYWTFPLEELRKIFDVQYPKWYDLHRYALVPALAEINDFGTVIVTMEPQKVGKAVVGVRFDWKWKTIDEARVTDEENEQPKGARHMDRTRSDAPPLSPAGPPEGEDDLESREARSEADRAAAKAWMKAHPGRTLRQYFDEKEERGA
jgi:hypothetical protein